MRQNYFLKTAFALILCASISMVSATRLYLSNSGLDTNTGLTRATAVRTLSKAFTISLAGDTIQVMDFIEMISEPSKTTGRADIDIEGDDPVKVLVKDNVTYTTWNATSGNLGIVPHTRSVTLIGDDKASCGFDGNGGSCIIRQDHSTGSTVITYKNLTFKNGKSNDASGGGAFYLRGGFPTVASSAVFENCDFITNTGSQGTTTSTLKNSGAIFMKHGALTLKKCRFAENMAAKGGAMYLEGGNISIDSCVIEDHDLSGVASSNAAAILTTVPALNMIINLDIKNTLFKNNKSATYGGAFVCTEVNAATTAGTSNIKFSNCAFVNNTSGTGLGGAVYVNNTLTGTTADISFINSTFTGNISGVNTAGAIAVNSLLTNSKFNMINCTVSGNKVTGAIGAGGAGVRFLANSALSVRKILNTIIENNTALDLNPALDADYSDLGMADIVNVDPLLPSTPSYVAGTTLIIEKSIIGSCKSPNFSTEFPNNKSNHVVGTSGNIADTFIAKLGAFNDVKNYFPLLEGSPAIGYGMTSYLTGLTPAVITDQIMRYRPATICSAGAYEYETVTSPPTGIANIANNSMLVYKNANNQLVVKNKTENTGTITVCNMMGQVVATAQMVGASTTINKAIKAGVYVVIVSVDGKVSTQKVILN